VFVRVTERAGAETRPYTAAQNFLREGARFGDSIITRKDAGNRGQAAIFDGYLTSNLRL